MCSGVSDGVEAPFECPGSKQEQRNDSLWFPSSWPARSREENGVEMTEAGRSSPRSTTSRCSAPVMAASATSLTVALLWWPASRIRPGSVSTVSKRRYGPVGRWREQSAAWVVTVGASSAIALASLRAAIGRRSSYCQRPAAASSASWIWWGLGEEARVGRGLCRPQDWKEGRGRPCRLPGHGGTPR